MALATAPQNMFCFAHTIRPPRPVEKELNVCGFAAGRGWRRDLWLVVFSRKVRIDRRGLGGLGAQPPDKNPLRPLRPLRLTTTTVDLNRGCRMRSCGAGMRPRRRRRVGRGRSPSREAAARARARTPTIGVSNTKNTEESKGTQNAKVTSFINLCILSTLRVLGVFSV